MSSLLRVIFDPDTTAPSVPSILSVTAVGQGRLDITWTLSTDTGGSGLAGYDLLKDGATVIPLGIQQMYSDTGLTPSSAHNYRVRARDGAGNASGYSTQAAGTVAAASTTYNPNYPRFGSYALGGTQNSSDASLAQQNVAVVSTYPSWQQSKGTTWAAKCANIRSLSTIGTIVVPYVMYSEIADVNVNPGNAYWEVWQQAENNNQWVYQNGLTETTRIASSGAGLSKINYTTAAKVVSGDNFLQWKLRWDYRLNVTGGTFSNGTGNVPSTANGFFDGVFFDNVFAQERPAVGTGARGDYDLDGVQDVLTSSTSKALIQSSHAAAASFYRTLHPNAYVLANSADWPSLYPTGLAGTPLDQVFDGCLMEHLEDWDNGNNGSTMTAVLNAISVQMNACRAPKLGIASVLISSITNYSSLRYWHGICALTDAYYYPHLTTGLLAQELGTLQYDERTFSLGAAIDPVQTVARYQAGANGTGVYRRDFANGIVLVAARGATYTTVTLGGTFYRLLGTLDSTTNNAAAVTTVTLTAGNALVLSRSPLDTAAPTAPNGLTATAASTSTINLAWNASTDSGGSGLAGYRVERSLNGSTGWNEISTPTGTSYSDTGRSAGTQYFYRVRAYDNALNNSAYTLTANATTQSAGGALAFTPQAGFTLTGASLGDGVLLTLVDSQGRLGNRTNGKPVYFMEGGSLTPHPTYSRTTSYTGENWGTSDSTVHLPNGTASHKTVMNDSHHIPGATISFGTNVLYARVASFVNFAASGALNWKSSRIWADDFLNNTWIFEDGSAGSGGIAMTSNGTQGADHYGFAEPVNSWLTREWEYRKSSSPSTQDGIVHETRNGIATLDPTRRWKTYDSSGLFTKPYNLFNLDQFSGTQPSGSIWVGEQYVDDELRRIEWAGAASHVWSQSAPTDQRELCIPLSWSTSGGVSTIQFYSRLGQRSSLTGITLNVITDYGTVFKVGVGT